MNTTPEVETKIRIILSPLVALLKSRKFVAAAGAILVSLLIAKVPDLSPYADALILGVMLVAAVLTGSIAHEDAAARKAAAIEASAKTQKENLQSAIEAAVDALYERQSAGGTTLTAEAISEHPDPSMTQAFADLVVAKLVEREREAISGEG